MGLVGRLEDLALPDIFQILSLSKKTGKLTLTRREGNGIILFKNGEVIYAASDSVRDTLGNILVCQKLITESLLMSALEIQHKSAEGKKLGTILVEKGYITRETLEKTIRGQIEKVIHEFLTWKSGFFKFELMEVVNEDEIAVDTQDFLLKAGINPEYLILEGVRRLDEQKKGKPTAPPLAPAAEARARGVRPETPPAPAPIRTDPTPAERMATALITPAETSSPPRPLTSLKSILTEIRSPSFTGEITLLIMRYASTIVNRGVLFVLKKDGITGMGQFGLDPQNGSADERVRGVKIPTDQPSVFYEVIEKKQTYIGPLEETPWNASIIKELDGITPAEVVAIPMIVSGTVVVIFYGDNVPLNQPIGDVEGLELLMNQAGLAMEKSLLEMKIKSFERQFGRRPLPR